MRMEIGEIIRTAREEKGMSEEVCARICALSPEDYRKMEAGKLAFGKGEIVLLSNALEISSLALQDGWLVRKKDLPGLAELIEKLEIKIAELQSGLAEIRVLIDETLSKELAEHKLPEADYTEPEEERSEELCLK